MQTVRRSYSWVIAIAIITNLISFSGFIRSSVLPVGVSTELVLGSTPEHKSGLVIYASVHLSKVAYTPPFLTLGRAQVEYLMTKNCNVIFKAQNLSIRNSLASSSMLRVIFISGLRRDPVDDYLLV